ncbi:hypothetical protein PHMEG_00010483 [Phytophthora megakarya]|uniref:Uncharacterized protein n=1 Tax=Phytophthora megakarya TaxID=4795 RepID=A0A225WDK3_9STRA|nr:hypothetical protein PHMEG_00010483 [Phytophthora megakarya]
MPRTPVIRRREYCQQGPNASQKSCKVCVLLLTSKKNVSSEPGNPYQSTLEIALCYIHLGRNMDEDSGNGANSSLEVKAAKTKIAVATMTTRTKAVLCKLYLCFN